MSDCHSSSQDSERTVSDEGVSNQFSFKAMVVDNKKDDLDSVASKLRSCSFEVTCAEQIGAALSVLSKKDDEFDIFLIDSKIADVDVQTVLRLTKCMNFQSMVMSEKVDDSLIIEAYKNGGLLVLQKPLTIDVVNILCQLVMARRMLMSEKYRNKMQVYRFSEDLDDDATSIRRTNAIVWTPELHKKFVSAVDQLGEGRCSPSRILKLMGVPGLTRLHICSYLQKYQKGKFTSRKKRRMPSSSRSHASSSNLSAQRVKTRKFGKMPSMQINQDAEEEDSSKHIELKLSLNGWLTKVNHMKNQISRARLQMMNGSGPQNFVGEDSIHQTKSVQLQIGKPYILHQTRIPTPEKFSWV